MSAQQLAACRDSVLDGLALNDAQRLLIFNPSEAVDSIAERVARLTTMHGVPEQEAREIFAGLREVLELNGQEGGIGRHAAGTLDDLATAARNAGRTPAVRPPSVKQLAALIRAAQDDGSVGDLIAATPRARLTQRSLLHELGKQRSLALYEALGSADHAAVTT